MPEGLFDALKPDEVRDTLSETADRLDGMADAYAASLVLGLVGRAIRAEGEEAARIREGHAPLFEAAEAALASIANEEQRRALIAHYVEGKPWLRVASELGCSEKTAKRRGAEAAKSFAAALREIRKGT
jgi:RNA polymerase sigma factor for flagellar operon FliA